ncbi:unnamed protein product [Tetraodon nigroviridis]|uniref:(spotted green pufferfish) hypothetical protein n=1 Tax=Tetraodon nigroviridis TaxID=99883 RepID=Q4RT08_TETNG|nr:unnamed protein product [Tetraodon nigroviridis]
MATSGDSCQSKLQFESQRVSLSAEVQPSVPASKKCRKDEEAPEWKKVQVNHAELSLSGLQQRRKVKQPLFPGLTEHNGTLEGAKVLFYTPACFARTSTTGCRESRAGGGDKLSGVCSERQQGPAARAAEAEAVEFPRETGGGLRAPSDGHTLRESAEEQAAESRLSELQGDLDECTTRKGVLEKTLARKELQLFDLQEQQRSWCAERDGLRGALQVLGNQLSRVAKEAQEQTPRRVVKEAVEEERRRCEAQQAEAVRVQRERLEEEIRQRERSVALALKEEAAQLKTVRPLPCGIAKVGREAQRCCARTIDVAGPSLQKLQEMERDSCAQQGGREPWLAAVCQTLGEEHQAEPQRSERRQTPVAATSCQEQERRLQAKHLGSERDQALRTVTERLLQEHVEELSSWRWARLDDGGADGGAAASLRKQLRAKDAELEAGSRRHGSVEGADGSSPGAPVGGGADGRAREVRFRKSIPRR